MTHFTKSCSILDGLGVALVFDKDLTRSVKSIYLRTKYDRVSKCIVNITVIFKLRGFNEWSSLVFPDKKEVNFCKKLEEKQLFESRNKSMETWYLHLVCMFFD